MKAMGIRLFIKKKLKTVQVAPFVNHGACLSAVPNTKTAQAYSLCTVAAQGSYILKLRQYLLTGPVII